MAPANSVTQPTVNQVADEAHQVGQHQDPQGVLERQLVNTHDHRRAQHAEHLDSRPVQQDRQAQEPDAPGYLQRLAEASAGLHPPRVKKRTGC